MKYFISLVFCLIFCAAYSQVTIVVLGSSTAAGTGVSEPDSAWVNRYRTYLQDINPANEVINLAHGGYTTFHILPTGTTTPAGRPNPDDESNISAAINEAPDAIIINLPSNDAASIYAVTEQLANYETVVTIAATANIPVWIATTQPRGLNLAGRENLKEMRDSTHSIYGDKAIDFWTILAKSSGSINFIFDSGDGVHLNDRGHKILFERVVAKNIPEAILTRINPVFNNKMDIRVYPNPVKNRLHIDFGDGLPTESQLQIIDITGRQIKSVILEKYTKSIDVVVAEIPEGVYQLLLSDGTHLQNQLFLKNG